MPAFMFCREPRFIARKLETPATLRGQDFDRQFAVPSELVEPPALVTQASRGENGERAIGTLYLCLPPSDRLRDQSGRFD